MSFHINRDGSTIVDPNYFWIPRVEMVPTTSSKVQLINQPAGCATYGTWSSRDDYWTHWAPLPKFKPKGYVDRGSVNIVKVDRTLLMLAISTLQTGTMGQRKLAEGLENSLSLVV